MSAPLDGELAGPAPTEAPPPPALGGGGDGAILEPEHKFPAEIRQVGAFRIFSFGYG